MKKAERERLTRLRRLTNQENYRRNQEKLLVRAVVNRLGGPHTILVVAHNYEQYRVWKIDQEQWRRYFLLEQNSDLWGRRLWPGVELVKLTNWSFNKDADFIQRISMLEQGLL